MTSVAARKRSRKLSAKLGTRTTRKAKPATLIAHTNPNPPKHREKTGLEWLVHKSRISERQAKAGKRYGEDSRIAAMHGVVPLRSCLNDTPGGGSSAERSLPAAEYQLEATERLAAAQAALSWQDDLIAACDLICARQLTPWQAIELSGGGARDVAKLEAVTVVALDLLDKHYRMRG